MPRPTPAIVPLLERSRLLSAPQWSELRHNGTLEDLRQNGSIHDGHAAAFLMDLVRRGWLTSWQAEMLQRGQSGFFVGQYRLLECIGQGGNGHVFRAQHATLGREAAIKVLAPAIVRNRNSVARFEQEIQAAAALDHPHIVRAYDAGTAGDVHYLVMEYVEGRNLGEVAAAYGPLPIGWTCECLRQVAYALQHAHERGMVHRDIKPSNVLVSRDDETGRPRVKLLDLGLARFVSESLPDSGLTQSGQVLGTPDYISPEQAAETRKADIRSDVFSLGCTLFHLLTGTVPFGGGNVMEKLMARATHDAPPIRTRRPDVPATLESVVARMLDRDPTRRYQTPGEAAEALAQFALLPSPDPLALPTSRRIDRQDDDANSNLDRFLSRLAEQMDDDATVDVRKPKVPPASIEPVSPQPPFSEASSTEPSPPGTSEPERSEGPRSRWKPLTALLVAACVLVVGVAWGSAQLWSRWGSARVIIDWPVSERDGARLSVDDVNAPLPSLPVVTLSRRPGTHKLRAERAGYLPVETTLDLTRDRPQTWKPVWKPTAETLREAELQDLRARVVEGRASSEAQQQALRSRCLDFARIHRGTPAGLKAYGLLGLLPCPLDRLQRSQVPPPELFGAGDGPAPPELVGVLGDSRLRHWNEVQRIVVHPRGELMASAGRDGTVRVWQIATGNLVHKWYVGEGDCRLAFSPTQNLLATGAADREIAVWDLDAGTLRATLSASSPPFAFISDGQSILADAGERGLGVWSVVDGVRQRTLPRSTASLVDLHVSPHGPLIAAEYADASTVVLDLQTNTPRFELKAVRHPAFNADGSLLAAEKTDDASHNDVGLWETTSGQSRFVLDEAGRPVDFASDGLVLTTRPGRVTFWNAATGAELNTYRDVPELLAMTPDRRWLAAADQDFGTMQFWNVETGQSTRAEGHLLGVTDVAFTPDSQLAVTASRDHSLKIWRVAQGVERALSGRGIGPVDVAPDGRTLLFASDDGTLKLWDVATGKPSRTLLDGAKAVRRVAFSTNGRVVACVGDWGFFQFTLRLFEAGSGKELSLAGESLGAVRAFEFHPDGRHVAVANSGRDVTIFDVENREPPVTLDGDLAEVRGLAWSPDGRWLAIAAGDEGAIVWDRNNSQRHVVALKEAPHASSLAFCPDGQRLVIGTSGDAVIWNVATNRLQGRLAVPGRALSAMSWRPDGQSLAGVNNSGQLHLWDFSPDRQPDPRMAASAPRPPSRTLTLGPRGGILSHVAFSPEGRHVLTVNGNGTIYVLRLTDADE